MKTTIWLFRKMVTYFFKMDYHNMMEAYYWLNIHLTYKRKRIK